MPIFGVYANSPDTAIARQYLDKAMLLIDSMAMEEALDLTEKAISIYRATPDGLTQLGYAYNVKGSIFLEEGDYETAFNHFTKAKNVLIPHFTEIHPEVAESYNKMGICFFEQRAIKDAEIYYQQALAIRLQVFNEKHPKVADSYNNLGNCAIEQNDIQAAYQYYQQTLNIRLQLFGELNAEVAASYNNLGYCYLEVREYPKAIELFLASLKIRETVLGKFHIKIAQNCQSLANAYIQTDELELATNYLKKALEVYEQNNQNNHPDAADILNSLGFVKYTAGAFDLALNYYDNAKHILSTQFESNNSRFWNLYKNLGDLFLEQGDYNKALIYYQNNFQILKGIVPDNHPNFGHIHNSIGTAYAKMRESKKALDEFEKALSIFTKNEDPYYIGITYNKIGNVHSESKNAKAAIPVYQQSLTALQTANTGEVKTIASLLTNLGACFIDAQNHKKAQQLFEQSINLIEKEYGKQHPELVENYLNLGVLKEKEGKSAIALNHFKRAEQLLKFDLEKEIHQLNSPPSQLLRLLNNKAASLNSLYKKEKQVPFLTNALNHYNYAVKIVEVLKKQYQEEASQQILGQLANRSFTGAIEVCHTLFEVTKDTNYIEKAFIFSEQSRSSILLEVLNTNQAVQFANIPDSLIATEKSLKNKITYYEKKKQALIEVETQSSSVLLDKYNKEIFILKGQHEALIKQFETTYPAYHQLKYNNKIISIQGVQQDLLVDSTALVEYFMADSVLYVFTINKQSVAFQAISFPNLLETMKMLRMGLYLPLSDSEEKHKLAAKIYRHTAYYLYQQLIEPIESKLSNKVIIINGGLLNSIPFESLLSTLPDSTQRLKSYDYLLKKYEFSYAYSATLLQAIQIRQTSNNNGQLIAFAPDFTTTDYRKLAPLKYNIPEVQAIQQLFNSKTYTGTTATTQHFTEQVNNYQMIHLATHAVANTDLGDFSYLAFNADTVQADLLYAKDVYNLTLNAELVVLSACETGKGTLVKGEGMIGLGNAFFYAGAKSIISTLWSIDDHSTKALLTVFYEQLKKGQSKSEALRFAKLHFLKNSTKPHPYYWASFIANGDMHPIIKPSSNYFKWGMISCFIMGAFFMGYRKFSDG